MANNQPLARHSIDKAKDDANAAMQDLRSTISEARLVIREMGDVADKMRSERELWSKFFHEDMQERISLRVKKEMTRLEAEVTALIAHTDEQIRKRFAGLERSLLATLMNNPTILAIGEEMAMKRTRAMRPPHGKGIVKRRTEFRLPEGEQP